MVTRKCRTICFRVSEEDYRALKNLCEVNGGRSVSEVARSAMQEFLAGGANHAGDRADAQVEGISGRLSALERAVERLAELMARGQEHAR